MPWGTALSAVLQNLQTDGDQLHGKLGAHVRGAILVQEKAILCGLDAADPICRAENFHILCLVVLLCSCITIAVCALNLIRDDKEESITPLCPQLIVRGDAMKFQMPWADCNGLADVIDLDEKVICKVALDFPDPMSPGFVGVAATVRLLSTSDIVLAAVVARVVAVTGQGLALCRAGCEIFGFVEADPRNHRKYSVRHRTNIELLKLQGDFDSPNFNVSVVNPAGLEVGNVKCVGGTCYGHVLPNVDAGLVLSSLFAVRVDRKLSAQSIAPQSPWDASPNRPTPHVFHFEQASEASGTEVPAPSSHAIASEGNLHTSDEERGSMAVDSDGSASGPAGAHPFVPQPAESAAAYPETDMMAQES